MNGCKPSEWPFRRVVFFAVLLLFPLLISPAHAQVNGIATLKDFAGDIIVKNQKNLPVENVMGYLEHPGPKLGRDYSDYKLESMLIESIDVLKRYFVRI